MQNAFLQIYKSLYFSDFAVTFDTAIVFEENGVSKRAGVTQLVECDLAKVDVAGSNPVSRSSQILPGINI